MNLKPTTIILLLTLWFFLSNSAQQATLSGYVYDKESNEPLVGASVWDSLTSIGTYTNSYGFFSLTLPEGAIFLKAGIPSFQTFKKSFLLQEGERIEIYLEPASLDEVLITDHQIKEDLGLIHIPISQIRRVPSLLGEQDIIKALSLTPGVSLGWEGSSGLLVRGGGPDQNLILLDDAPVYNVSHLFGFISTFNTDAIKNVDLYKGAFPARYGSRLSSVVDVTMKEGNAKKRKGEASVGIISSRLMLEGPMKDSSYTYLLSGRSSYVNLLTLPLFIAYKTGNSIDYYGYWMYDGNLKLSKSFKDQSRLSLSAYIGQDDFQSLDRFVDEIETTNRLKWGNITSTLRYGKSLGSKLFFSGIGTLSCYRYAISSKIETRTDSINSDAFSELASSVFDASIKLQFHADFSKFYSLKWGGSAIRHQYIPNFVKENSNERSTLSSKASNRINALEYAVFLENHLELGNWLSGNLGFRYASFEVEDRIYRSYEPRLSISISLPGSIKLKGAFSRMQQPIHLLTNNGVGFPNDIWVPATASVSPQQANQYSVGISQIRGIGEQQYTWSIEAYDKEMQNLIDYSHGVNIVNDFSQNWQNLIERQGIGRARGIELFVHKPQGKINGWASYSYSVNERRFDNINEGAWYPANYDRRHDFSITGNYQLDSWWNIGCTWVFSSGQPVTLPKGIYTNVDGEINFIYGGRNNERVPSYHRLDIGFTYTDVSSKGKTKKWSFGLYNAYGRRNPLFLEIEPAEMFLGRAPQAGDTNSYRVIQRSVFPFLPYLAYSWDF